MLCESKLHNLHGHNFLLDHTFLKMEPNFLLERTFLKMEPNFLLECTFLKVERNFLLDVDPTFVEGTLFTTTQTSFWEMNDLSSVSEIFVSSFSMLQSDGRLNLVKLFIFPCFVTTLHSYSVSLSIAFGQCAFGLLFVQFLFNVCLFFSFLVTQ